MSAGNQVLIKNILLMKVKNYSIHPSVYFIVAALLIAYFFPREGKFRYQFYEGKPWRYGLLTAPSDFPIYKTDAEVQAERDSALKKFEPYYRLDASIESKEIDKLRAGYRNTLKDRATPAYMQYIENSLQKLYRDGIISTQDMDELKKEEYPRINLLAGNVAQHHYSSEFFTVKTAYEFIIRQVNALSTGARSSTTTLITCSALLRSYMKPSPAAPSGKASS